jgi:MarR family transcriptional regulator, organic hydroperoxide resistance regulator
MTSWSVQQGGAGDRPRSGERQFVIGQSPGYLVNRLARSMAGQLAERIRPAGVGIGQWAVLLFLWERDGMSQAELSRVVAIEPPTMVRTIDRMVRDGLVTRVADPADGRVSRIHLTDRGRALRDELVPMAVAVNEATLARLTERERAAFQRLLTKLTDTDQPVRPDRPGGRPRSTSR